MDDRTDPTRPAARMPRATTATSTAGRSSRRRCCAPARSREADALNIAEELDDVGNEQYDKLESALRLILLHLLKWDHQPERRSRSWHGSIAVQRNHVQKVLRKNPGLKPLVDEAVAEAYNDARARSRSRDGPR